MTSKQFACSLLFTFLCCSLLAVAQAPPVDNDSAFVKGKGTTGTIALWTATKKIGNSTITQDGGGNQNFAAGINAVGVISGSSDVDALATSTQQEASLETPTWTPRGIPFREKGSSSTPPPVRVYSTGPLTMAEAVTPWADKRSPRRVLLSSLRSSTRTVPQCFTGTVSAIPSRLEASRPQFH